MLAVTVMNVAGAELKCVNTPGGGPFLLFALSPASTSVSPN